MIIGSAPTWTGSLPTWLLLAIALIGAWRVTRGGGGTAVTELSKANEVLEEAGKKKDAQIHTLQSRIATLEARTDIAQALQPLSDSINNHEERAQARFEKTSEILTLVADRLHETPDTKGTP